MTFDEETHELRRRRFWSDVFLAVCSNGNNSDTSVYLADVALQSWDTRFKNIRVKENINLCEHDWQTISDSGGDYYICQKCGERK